MGPDAGWRGMGAKATFVKIAATLDPGPWIEKGSLRNPRGAGPDAINGVSSRKAPFARSWASSIVKAVVSPCSRAVVSKVPATVAAVTFSRAG